MAKFNNIDRNGFARSHIFKKIKKNEKDIFEESTHANLLRPSDDLMVAECNGEWLSVS